MDHKILYINWLPIGPPSKIYEDEQATFKISLTKIINNQARPLDVLITDLHEIYLTYIFEMVYTISNMQLADLNSKPHDGKVSGIS